MKKVQGNDSFQRINYLYQISKHIVEKNPLLMLSSYYGNLIVNVAKKNVLKIHPEVKRQICKKCRCTLISDVSANLKMTGRKRSKAVSWTCLTCGTKKVFPVNKEDSRVWVERPEAVVEVIN